jgi:hypothetical protein
MTGEGRKNALKIFLVIIGFIVVVNLIGYGIATRKNSLILKIKPLNRVFVFAHGYNHCLKDGGYSHMLNIDGDYIATTNLLDNLRGEGYNNIWISMCDQGNSNYVLDYGNGTKIEWGDDVSRVKESGTVYPIYWGLGIYRLTLNNAKLDVDSNGMSGRKIQCVNNA